MANILRQPCDEGVLRSGKCRRACSRDIAPWVLTATILGSGMVMIDSSAVNVALPVLQEELGADVTEAQWIVESYALLLAALLLLGGSLGDRYGRRRVFNLGVVLFTLASVWCGLAPSSFQLIIARAVQGAGGALLTPGSLAILSSSFPQDQRGRAIGTWSAFTPIAAALGPVLGGWLVESFSWRWVFLINVPLAAFVLFVSLRFVPESRDPEAHARLDWWGAVLAPLGLGGIVYGLIESATLGLTHPLVVAAMIGGAVFSGLFFWAEAHGPAPMLPLRLFRSRSFAGSNLLTLLLYGALGGTLFFLPFNLVQLQGYSPTAAGAAMLPLILVLFLLSRTMGGLADRLGSRWLLTVGPMLSAFGFALLAAPGVGGSYWITHFPGLVVLGVGMSICVAPLTTTVMNSVDERFVGVASGVNNAVARTAGLLAIAVMGVFVVATFNSRLDSALEGLELSATVRQQIDDQRINLAAAKVPEGLDPVLRSQLAGFLDESFLAGYRLAMGIAAGLAFASAIAGWLTIPGRPRPAEAPALAKAA